MLKNILNSIYNMYLCILYYICIYNIIFIFPYETLNEKKKKTEEKNIADQY